MTNRGLPQPAATTIGELSEMIRKEVLNYIDQKSQS